MTNYFYFDQNNQQHGPVNEQQLHELASQGVINPNTPLETDTGHKGVAEQIPGLTFNVATSSPFGQSASQPSNATTSLAMSILMWPLDFAFHDIRLPCINLWACRITYALCCIGAILWGLVLTFSIFTAVTYGDTLAIIFAPLVWLGVVLFILAARLFCEWYIIVFDWIVETTKAARLYTANNE